MLKSWAENWLLFSTYLGGFFHLMFTFCVSSDWFVFSYFSSLYVEFVGHIDMIYFIPSHKKTSSLKQLFSKLCIYLFQRQGF